jgi:hypothetical protein
MRAPASLSSLIAQPGAPTHKGSYTPFGLVSSLRGGGAGDVPAPAATGLPLGYLAAFALIVRRTRCLT